MRILERYTCAFDGLPLLSGASFKAPGLFFLRVTYLLFSAIPLLLSLLKAAYGVAQTVLFFAGILILAVPLLIDVIRRMLAAEADLSALTVIVSCALLIRFSFPLYAAMLLYFYHLCDLCLAIPLRALRTRINPGRLDLEPTQENRTDSEGRLHIGEGELLNSDCKVISGSAVCSVRLFDPASGDFEARSGDILFSGTRIEEGSLVCEVLRGQSANLQMRVSKRLSSAWNSKSRAQRNFQSLCFGLQLFLILLQLWYFAKPFLQISAPLCVFLILPFLSDFYFRADRLRLLLALDRFVEFGIYPESIQVLSRIPRAFSRLLVLDARKLSMAQADRETHRYRLSFHPQSRYLTVLEYAGESSARLPCADLVLLFRAKEAISPHAARLAQSALLERLLFLFAWILFSALYLLLSLGASFLWMILATGGCLLFAVMIFWRIYFPLKESYLVCRVKLALRFLKQGRT